MERATSDTQTADHLKDKPQASSLINSHWLTGVLFVRTIGQRGSKFHNQIHKYKHNKCASPYTLNLNKDSFLVINLKC